MSSTVSAPHSRASAIWYSEKTNSFRRMAGRFGSASTAARARRMSSRLPLNQVGSVSTEITDAPAWA